MKFIVEPTELVDAVNWVARSLSSRPIKAELLGIMIDVDTSITLTGSDLETSTKAILKAEISAKGKVLVPGRLLAEIARSLPNKPITFTRWQQSARNCRHREIYPPYSLGQRVPNPSRATRNSWRNPKRCLRSRCKPSRYRRR